MSSVDPSSAPLVSIVIPTYNAERWLAATLESVFAQSYPNLEIVIVDDESTDQTPALARTYQNRGVQVIRQPNRGAASARNHGLRLSRGQFVKFLDADDLLSPESISQQVAALSVRPANHLAVGAWARFHESPQDAVFTPRPGWHDAEALDWIKETWADTQPMYQCGLFLIPRSLLEIAGGWDERLSLVDDFEFFTRLVLASSGIVFTPEARLYYRSGIPGSLSARKSRRAWESARLSTTLAVAHLLSREDSAATRRLSADMLQLLVYELYPAHASLSPDLIQEIRRLGGSARLPDGGPTFKRLTRLIGWKLARRLQSFRAS